MSEAAEATETQTEVANEQQAATEVKNEPDKLDQILAENKKLQQALTRQGYELGELRKLKPLVDKVLQEKKEPVDFFADPEKAVSEQIASHPKVQELEASAANLRKMEMVAKLKEAHPDYAEVAQNAAFIEWVKASKIRTTLFQQADAGYDFDSGNELLTNWKERQVAEQAAKAAQLEKAKGDLSKAKVGSGQAAGGGKTYSRTELMTLKQTDPEKYESLDVSRLYAEGRVK